MAKRDIAQTIVNENPDENYDVETLEEENTERELVQLRDELREQKDQPPEANVTAETTDDAADSDADDVPAIPPEREAIQDGDKDSTLYRLRDPQTSYNDINFTLAGDQKKPLPANPSGDLLDRIDAGFIVEAGDEE